MNDKFNVKLPHKSLWRKLLTSGYTCRLFNDTKLINSIIYNGVMKSNEKKNNKMEYIVSINKRNILIEVSRMDLKFSTIINDYYGDRGYNIIYKINNDLLDKDRPYNREKRDLQSNVDFGVLSKYFASKCLKTFKDEEHKEALKINKEMN